MAFPIKSASRFIVPLLAGLVLPFAASASNFSYTYVEGYYGSVSVDDSDGDFDGDAWGLTGSWQFHDMFFAFGGYEWGDYDFDIETDTYQLGVGLAFPIGETVDLAFGASYVDVSVDIPFFPDEDDDGYGVFGGFRFGLGDAFQVDAGASYVDLSDSGSDTTYSIEGRYYFTDSWAVGAGYQTADDADAWLITLRWEMPR
jgi:predicted porin